MKDILADRNFAIHGFAVYESPELSAAARDISLRGKHKNSHTVRDQQWLQNILTRVGEVMNALIQSDVVQASLLDTHQKS